MPFAVGIVLSLGVATFARRIGLDRDRADGAPTRREYATGQDDHPHVARGNCLAAGRLD